MVCAIEKAVGREGWQDAVAKWQTLKSKIADYKFDPDGALKEWAMSEYTENNNHRHLSHLYPAWPAYETQSDPELAKAANIALDNRNKYNTSDATAGHGVRNDERGSYAEVTLNKDTPVSVDFTIEVDSFKIFLNFSQMRIPFYSLTRTEARS